MKSNRIVVLIDRHCCVCSTAGNKIRRLDEKMSFSIDGLDSIDKYIADGDEAQRLLSLDSMIVIDGEHLYSRSAAVLHIGMNLGGAYAVLSKIAVLIPVRLRDAVYILISRNRRRLSTCV